MIVIVDTEAYDLEKCLGKGMYGTVFKAVNLQTGETVALKTQRPAWVWEYYIVREIKARLTNPHMVQYNTNSSYLDVLFTYQQINSSIFFFSYAVLWM